ncbi:hypothetical protein [Acinetobacter junii]|uniref:hypothetical protein n=1 Tax=Acinetobacter junii TaxID=40215 RepID=UPI00124BFCCA|nr:hypothetical protein [Acinetobacter junii]
MDIEILKAEFEASECFKRFERVAQYVTFDFGTYCAKVDIPKDAEKFVSGLIFSWKAWREAKAHEAEKLKGCVVVPVNNTTIVAIEKMVEQQVEASGITDDVFRLDGEKILNAMLEAARGGNE